MSNCVVRSCGSRVPCSFVADHGIESGDHLSHDGDDNDFRFLVGCGETMVKDFESRIVPASAQSCHVEHVTNWQLHGGQEFITPSEIGLRAAGLPE
jgi:hypothetical protein